MSFPQFTLFPPEILSLILESCSSNDLTCLRLTCKMMYNFSPRKENISLENTDVGSLCGKIDSYQPWSHRMECHKASYEAVCKRNAELGRSTPEMKRKCRSGWSTSHCQCYTKHLRLHWRLKPWMPESFRYCGRCGMFTKRKKQHGNRCYHGQPRAAKNDCHYWTHTSVGGGSGPKIWRNWSKKRAIRREEARERQERESQRNGSGRYALRKLKWDAIDSKDRRGHR